jgi:hypothetical protein
MAPERLADPDHLPSGLPLAAYFLIPLLIAVAVIVVLHIETRKARIFQRPTFDRAPFKRLSDSLQVLFIATIAWFAAAVGASVRLPDSGSAGLRFVIFSWCIPTGFFIGELFGYILYRRKITIV